MANIQLIIHAPFLLQTSVSGSHRKHDLLRADFTCRDVLVAFADDLFQPSIELLHRDVLHLSIFDQPWNLLQERGEHTPGVIVRVKGGVTETIGGEDIDHCRGEGWSVGVIEWAIQERREI